LNRLVALVAMLCLCVCVSGATIKIRSQTVANADTTHDTAFPRGTKPVSSALPSPWVQIDVGLPPVSGTATYLSTTGLLTMTGSGDIHKDTSAYHFVYQQKSGNWRVEADIQTLTGADAYISCGPFITESLASDSKFSYITPNLAFAGGKANALNRTTTGSGVYEAQDYSTFAWTSGKARIEKIGSTFTEYVSTDGGSTWSTVGSGTWTPASTYYIGVAVDAGTGSTAATCITSLPVLTSLPSAGIANFSSSTLTTREDSGTYCVPVTRTIDTVGAVSVQVQNAGTGSAVAGTDFTNVFPLTVSWADGVSTDACANVPILNRAGTQVARTLALTLGGASGITIGSTGSVTLTINDVSTGGSNAKKFRAGYYEDCYTWMPHGGDFNVFIGSDGYTAIKQCIDFAAANSPEKGVMIPAMWNSFEGDTAGCFNATCSNGLASAGKIGFPLWDDLLNYAQSKHMAVIIMWWWYNYYSDADCTATATDNSPNGSYRIRGTIPKYMLAPACGGTDSINTYHGAFWRPGFDGTTSTYFLKLWIPAVMSRWIAVENAYLARYDTHPALEMIMNFEEGDAVGAGIPYDGSADGYTFATLDAQIKRISTEIAPNAPHTNISIGTAWSRGAPALLVEATSDPSKAVGLQSNNTAAFRINYGEAAYVGAGVVDGINFGSHNYQTQLPFTVWTATPFELGPVGQPCQPYNNWVTHTSEEYYTIYMSTGTTDSGGKPVKPAWWITSANKNGAAYCPGIPTANWGSIGGTGWYHAIQSQPLNTTCPTQYTGGCDATRP
jgi:hypothetical protein